MSILFRNASVLSDHILSNVNLLVEGDTITQIGGNTQTADQVIDASGCLLMPGLVNAHTHLPMCLFRGYADDLPLQEWLGKIWPAEDKLTAEDVYWSTLLSAMEMIETGTTCLCDMYSFEEDIARAVEQSGLRAVLSVGILSLDGKQDKRLDNARGLYERWQGKADGRITTLIAPHAEYTNSIASLQQCAALADETGTGLHVHLSESPREVAECVQRHGCSPVELMYREGIFDRHVLAAHCVHLSERDMELLREKGVHVAHNPGSNLKLASGIAPVARLLELGVNVALGTDGAGSNNALDLWRELYLAAVLQKGISGDATAVTAEQALQMATQNGAQALKLNDLGTLEQGNKADLILVDLNAPWFQPMLDVKKLLVYSGTRAPVRLTMVNGRIIYKDGQHMTLDREEVKKHVAQIVKKILD